MGENSFGTGGAVGKSCDVGNSGVDKTSIFAYLI